jgi:hypothetical protein
MDRHWEKLLNMMRTVTPDVWATAVIAATVVLMGCFVWFSLKFV